MGNYYYKSENNKFIIYDGDNVLTTPSGKAVVTIYETLAKRIVFDLERYGMNFRSISSILSWHFTMIDNFAPREHAEVEDILFNSFLTRNDWTCRERHGADWSRVFGSWNERQHCIEQWLKKATHMQMTAACCIGNAYESINLAFVLAVVLENYEDEERDAQLRNVAQLLADTYEFGPFDDIYDSFKTFELYYGIHLKTDGAIACYAFPNKCEDDEFSDLDIDVLDEYQVTTEQLVGRNYYHYTNCQVDENQPAKHPIGDINLSDVEYYDEEDCEEDDEHEEDSSSELKELLPEDCWVKRIVDEEDPHTCYLIYLVVEDGYIEDSGCIEENSQSFGGGSFFFTIPGMDLEGEKTYEYNSYPPEFVVDELRLLLKGKSIPLDFAFIGKRLPQKIINAGGNGGSNTEYTYALQSAYRMAYMHMSVDTSEDGIIEDFTYSTYRSTGNSYGDMFSRPESLSDRTDEAMDMLLYIYDKYTDEELLSH